MPSNTKTDDIIQLTLLFPKANVSFSITCTNFISPDGDGHFAIKVNSYKERKPIKLLESDSAQLYDWAKGYARWLHRASIKAEHNENAIEGKFSSVQSPESALENIREACLMIRQRFEHYETSILN
tara:strand:- start:415 stop:792 length:378 start_codon:yes stop_codon:yes gene_type:complete